ncbi:unnamed protein product [Nesidiocoris tenuis]|uniref:Ig-like domain-containing protein n=1 Tax=Nesidiocoris tenuis TaxID=355587 RepID=A0A6H5H1R8_9HEMI|nr:unnamed protein product [Nesidiocoris tenuis]CAB0009285.1 unnamed protein product [Nesidiocoris tenuis]
MLFNLLFQSIFDSPSCSAKLKVDVKVPRYRLRGELAILQCLFNLDNGSVYSVKWYKDNEEFFRYVPRSDPKIQWYKLDGVKVDHVLSDSRQVALKPVNLKSTGTYKCEVSGEGPNFESDNAEKVMEVISTPTPRPRPPPQLQGTMPWHRSTVLAPLLHLLPPFSLAEPPVLLV